jgi:hypothetical protein
MGDTLLSSRVGACAAPVELAIEPGRNHHFLMILRWAFSIAKSNLQPGSLDRE